MASRSALRILTIVAMVCLVAAIGTAPAAAESLAGTLIGARESISRFNQDLRYQPSVADQVRFLREHAAAQAAAAEALAGALEGHMRTDSDAPRVAHLGRIAVAAREFARTSRAALVRLDDPGAATATVLSGVQSSAGAYASALDGYPITWLDRLTYQPMLWVAAGAGAVIAVLATLHAACWAFGRRLTWAQRDRRRVHAQLSLLALAVLGGIAGLSAALFATHSLDNGPAVLVVACVALAGVAAMLAAERRMRELLVVLKEHDRPAAPPVVPPPAPLRWAPHDTTIVEHLVPIPPLPPFVSETTGVLLLSEGLRADPEDAESVRTVVLPVARN